MKRVKVLVVVAMMASSFVVLVGAPLPAGATTYECNTHWCSGSDGSTATNAEGNTSPQIYIGEIGYYASDRSLGGTQSGSCTTTAGGNVPGGDGTCFNGTAATNSNNRYYDNGGSIGTDFYWFAGGPNAGQAASYPNDYCWGWAQGYAAENEAFDYYSSYLANADLMFFDIEQNAKFGWAQAGSPTGSPAEDNRAVFNGFSDYVAGRSSKDPSDCTGVADAQYQYGVYSSPDQWHW